MKSVKPPRLKKLLNTTIIVFVVIAAATTIYLALPSPPPRVSIEFNAFKPEETKVFHLVADTNDYNQLVYQSDSRTNWWFQAFPSSKQFSLDQTNVFCLVYLTNHGPTRIWWIPMDCQVEARTPIGWVTNRFGHFSTVPWSVGSLAKDDFSIYIPTDAMEWRVTGQYEYYKHHNARREYVGWLLDDLKLSSKKWQPSKFVVYPLIGPAWILSLLPEPKGQSVEIQSVLFTNRPTILHP